MNDLLIIGGSDAGISAALRARELDPGWRVRLVLADRFPNYSICGLPFYLSGETPRWESLAHRSRAEIEACGIELLMDTAAERIDPRAHRVQVRDKAGDTRELPYDRLIVCTGAGPMRPPIRGLQQPGVYLLHTMADSFALHDHLEGHTPKTAVIVGAGYNTFKHRRPMKTVLFACIHNAGRSQMAAAWFNALANREGARAISAGTEPGTRVHPEVVTAMREVGIELEGTKPQKLTDELASTASILVTMGCGEACPVVPGLRRMDWPLEDPKGKPVERVREIRDEIRSRVVALLAEERWAKA
jgi:arsenate reductase (thioredoxin)